MKIMQRVSFAIVFAIAISLLLSAVAFAGGPYYFSQEGIAYLTGPTTSTTRITNTGCAQDNNTGTRYCRYLTQNSNATAYKWDTSTNNMYQWYVYCPTLGEAAAKYRVRESSSWYWDVIMNQANSSNQGTYVYMGYSDNIPNSGQYIFTSNACVTGYYCGSLKIYWDDIKYTTSP